jgi:hypothetical protein
VRCPNADSIAAAVRARHSSARKMRAWSIPEALGALAVVDLAIPAFFLDSTASLRCLESNALAFVPRWPRGPAARCNSARRGPGRCFCRAREEARDWSDVERQSSRPVSFVCVRARGRERSGSGRCWGRLSSRGDVGGGWVGVCCALRATLSLILISNIPAGRWTRGCCWRQVARRRDFFFVLLAGHAVRTCKTPFASRLTKFQASTSDEQGSCDSGLVTDFGTQPLTGHARGDLVLCDGLCSTRELSERSDRQTGEGRGGVGVRLCASPSATGSRLGWPAWLAGLAHDGDFGGGL